MSSISDLQLDKLSESLSKKLSESINTKNNKHEDDHKWIDQKRADEEDARQFRKKILNSMAIWAIFGAVAYVGRAVFKAVALAIKAGTL